MTPGKRATVELPELLSHARAVVQMQQPLDRVLAAVKEATPDGFDMAYGLYCQPIALVMRPFRENAEDIAAKVRKSVEATSDQLIKTVDSYDGADTGNAQMLRGIGANLSTAGNGLVAKGTKFDIDAYNPTKGGTRTQWDEENWAKGGGIVGDVWDLYLEITDKNKQNYGTMAGHIASIGANAASATADPIAALGSLAATWVLEHIKPLKLVLDGLAGNPEVVKAAATTWKNIGEELKRLGKHYTAAVNAGTGGWNGVAGSAYREKTAKNIIDVLESTGTLALTMSVVVGSTGEVVNLVRSAVRDLIGEAVGMAVSAFFQRFLAYKPPLEQLRHIAETGKKCKKLIDIMLAVVDLGPMVPMMLEAFKTVTAIIPKLDGI
jgi:hypothetical protein